MFCDCSDPGACHRHFSQSTTASSCLVVVEGCLSVKIAPHTAKAGGNGGDPALVSFVQYWDKILYKSKLQKEGSVSTHS